MGTVAFGPALVEQLMELWERELAKELEREEREETLGDR